MEIRIVIDDRIIDVLRRLRRLASRRNLTLGVIALVLASAMAAIAAPVDKPHTFAAGDPIISAEINQNFDALYDAFNDRVVREEETVSLLPEDGCDAVIAAIEGLRDKIIVGTVRIELGAGTYTCSRPIDIDHPDGHHISIVGLGATREDVILQFPAGSVGIRGNKVGGIDNLTLHSEGAGGSGISLLDAAQINAGSVLIQNFDSGVGAIHSAVFIADDVRVEGCKADGITASRGSVMRIKHAEVEGCGGHGFFVSEQSHMQVWTAIAKANAGSGVLVSGNSSFGGAVTASSNKEGVEARVRSVFDGQNVELTSNEDFGLYIGSGSYAHLTGSSNVSSNMTGDYNLTLNTFDGPSGSLIQTE